MTVARMQTLSRWIERGGENPTLTADPARLRAIASALRVSPLVARLLVQRGHADPDAAAAFLDPRLSELPEPDALPGVPAAAARLAAAVAAGRPVIVYGDYDVDGITAASILWHVLTDLGRRVGPAGGPRVGTYVPHRVEEGYGLHAEALERIARYATHPALDPGDGTPPLVVTVDCGITAVGAAARAAELGLDLIVTDHHRPPEGSPPDALLVHPELGGTPAEGFDPPPCGAGVAFFLAWATARVAMGTPRLPPPLKDKLVDLLSLAAMGTVADLVPLCGVNRRIVANGLKRLKATRLPGLAALIRAAKLDGEEVSATHVGFVIGPRINACGRMGHAAEAVELLTTATGRRAEDLAHTLTAENDCRRQVEREVLAEATEAVEAGGHATEDRRVIVLAGADWHPGVVGIVASRLVERYFRPVVLLAGTPEGQLRGSARSVGGVDLHACLSACAGHLLAFGGHRMAAGMTLQPAALDAFRAALNDAVAAVLPAERLCREVRHDGDAGEDDLAAEAIDALTRMAPFGMGNPRPKVRLRGLEIERPPCRMGGRGAHACFQLRLGNRSLRAVAFGRGDDAELHAVGDRLDAIAELKLNTWNGRTRPELHLVDFRPASPGGPAVRR
ncbi:single-stranded-DNA-specific exonuclease RecJ [Phycisphaera mikurensis]|uniref:Single-stranded-DNA-specific exonuclease RecJ n=1 Tax=Phycisphaera mikurensis (strain NBRC 102666 / KCTC 22515 / FYK2301M01) TaxID=1142394 RepID=I0IJ72_PHYMF|nr:single-stranded-DNA-specific exonuclease RecJ [Phycisphaera mikurensis]MBB6443282.1 single-stranded-DNA-specific exonuclease [Phycisphaera mikurensis]BAM05310.1 single-stranded-DNA-specific exonuclease RecJ [Phycisphaera mikurensis NBRC 102666]